VPYWEITYRSGPASAIERVAHFWTPFRVCGARFVEPRGAEAGHYGDTFRRSDPCERCASAGARFHSLAWRGTCVAAPTARSSLRLRRVLVGACQARWWLADGSALALRRSIQMTTALSRCGGLTLPLAWTVARWFPTRERYWYRSL
jgi:hypothetical protein